MKIKRKFQVQVLCREDFANDEIWRDILENSDLPPDLDQITTEMIVTDADVKLEYTHE